MPLRLFRPTRAPTFEARMQQARTEGYASGAREAVLFKIATDQAVCERQRALEWLNKAVETGRTDLQSQHALEREVEAWDMSCRIAFLVAIV
jgi:hypothetical protein